MSAVDIYGVFVPALFVMAIVAIGATKLVTVAFTRLGVYRLVWHRPLFDLAVFVIALGVVFFLVTSLQNSPFLILHKVHPSMVSFLSSTGRVVVTLIVVVIAAVVAWNIWIYYQDSPRTRDGTVRANVVSLAADVAGQVVEVDVRDDQAVRKGDVLFRIDPTRYTVALAQAKAALANQQAALEQAQHELERAQKLGQVASAQQVEQAATAAAQAKAGLDQAAAAMQLAQINLDRTKVVSPVNGTVTNLGLTQGSYVGAGSPVMALVDSDSFYVAGYFEETKLAGIHIGDPARIYLMGQNQAITGHVAGISPAISDPYRTTGANLLPSVSPSFTWVRLAQRIPVNIKLDRVPDGIRLVAGRTASIDIMSGS